MLRILQKEERKAVVVRKGTQKTRSHNAARGFKEHKNCRVAPATPLNIKPSEKWKYIPKMRVCTSIFVEMTAEASFFTTQNSLVLFERIFSK